MMQNVTEDTLFGARTGGRKSLTPTRSARRGTLALVGSLLLAATTSAQAGGPLGITITEAGQSSQSLIVPLNSSVILETTEPIVRVQVLESSIARVEAISSRQYLIKGVGFGTTQLMLWSEAGEREMIEVQVELDVGLLNRKLGDIDPQSDAEAMSFRGNIVLSGTVSSTDTASRMQQMAELFLPDVGADAAANIRNHLQIAGQQQVLLRCTVAEVARNATRKLGVNGFMAGDNFSDVFAVSQIGGLNPINIGAAGDVNVLNTIPFLIGEGGIPLSSAVPLSIGFPQIQMQLFIDAMADNALLRVLAEPDLVAISGETASFLAGGEFPIPVPQSGGAVGAVTIQFREFGVRVNFTPVVQAHQRIRLRIAPEVSETDFSRAIQLQGFIVPGLTQRRCETTVEVGNGQTLAVAGLLSEEIRGLASKIPALGDVPVLGALFRSTEYQRRQTELVFLVTPEIIAPMNPDQVPPVPGQDDATPSDWELYALGLLEGEIPEEDRVEPEPGGVYRTGAPTKVAPLRSQPEEMSLHGPWGYSAIEDL